jgi:hypothetical protein
MQEWRESDHRLSGSNLEQRVVAYQRRFETLVDWGRLRNYWSTIATKKRSMRQSGRLPPGLD